MLKGSYPHTGLKESYCRNGNQLFLSFALEYSQMNKQNHTFLPER